MRALGVDSPAEVPEAQRRRARAAERVQEVRRRSLMAEQKIEPVDAFRVYDRDGWRCQLCRRPVDRALDGNARMGPTLDHVVPLALGGEHSYANTQLAHRRCNLAKGAKLGDQQLALL